MKQKYVVIPIVPNCREPDTFAVALCTLRGLYQCLFIGSVLQTHTGSNIKCPLYMSDYIPGSKYCKSYYQSQYS